MPILMPSDTKVVLGADAEKCDSRSLFLDRFADPAARDEDGARKKWFQRLIAKPVALHRPALPLPAGSPPPLYAQLQSRLLVNMAGGVMENAGLALDRFGLPFIPGSAVKGCARRAALAALHEWSTTGHKPGASPDDADNLFKPACAPFGSAAEMLAAIAQVFGWGDSDWKESSDFAWATGGATLGEHAPSFAGSVAFLPAHPVHLEKTGEIKVLPDSTGQLELDVLTCHHMDYYGAAPEATTVATDDDDPNPVFFPAVAAGHVFAFPILSLPRSAEGLAGLARTWLSIGLGTFGLGAKTASGYGWFDATDATSKAVQEVLGAKRKRQAAQRTAELEAAHKKAEDEAKRQRKAEDDRILASLSPEERQDHVLCQLSDSQFRSALDSFIQKPPDEQRALVRALRKESEAPGSRRSFWDDLKAKAQSKGGKFGQIDAAIRQLSKQIYPGKEGKMP